MTNHNTTARRRALTLIEMLVGMAITLVMMAAVVNLFANISAGIRNRRATMEVSANLRIARARLYNDLAGATCLKYPKDPFGVMPKPDVNNPPDGYFEIVEGQFADENPGAGSSIDPATSLVPSSNDPKRFDANGNPVDPNYVTDGGGRGDYDDILAMTVESTTERFRGKGRGLAPGSDPTTTTGGQNGTGNWVDMTISSPVAEVVWFAVENPADRSQGEPGMRKIYRRTLLVVPWCGTETKTISNVQKTGSDPLLNLAAPPLNITTYAGQLAALRAFQQAYDISVRLENGKIVPNTLADLARRENRYEHMPSDFVSATPSLNYPHVFASKGFGYSSPSVQVIRHYLDTESGNATINAVVNNGVITDFNVASGGRYDIMPTLIVTGTTGVFATARPLMREVDGAWEIVGVTYGMAPLAFGRSGEDLVLNDVLAFDVQVFDPGAPLYQYAGSMIQPGGSTAFADPNSTNDAVGSGVLTGFGTYVDLGWNNGMQTGSSPNYTYTPDYKYPAVYAANPSAPRPLYQQERQLGWLPGSAIGLYRGSPSTYDTWTTYYETDGFDQDNRDGDGNYLTGADEGTNGLDDPAYYDGDDDPTSAPVLLTINGPDDPGERETSPPYPYPLKGVQVKLRMYEPESRQIRETTVTRNLVK